MQNARRVFHYLFDPAYGRPDHLIARWVFLRSMGLIYFSGPASLRLWFAPTLLWLNSSDHMLMALCWVGLLGSVILFFNLWPRAILLVCFLCFLSFVTAAQDFSGYQSDGMLLEAGFLSIFLAPSGLLPGLGTKHPPMRAAILLLLWEWFRIYFESGVVKLASGDSTWRNLTAMYEYYQNGPLPTWIGWYLQHLPHWFHIATAATTLIMELLLVWIAFLSRRWRIVCFFIVTAWQIGVIATANYTFLNYLVLVLAFLLLDDAFLLRFVPSHWRRNLTRNSLANKERELLDPHSEEPAIGPAQKLLATLRTALGAVILTWIFYATTIPLVRMAWHDVPLPIAPIVALDPFRIANQYGLFAVMTPHRYEIEFQGSNDGENWTAYLFRYKPQAVNERPRIYAPYQPRFDWNLWFASLGSWQEYPIVPRTEELLLENDEAVLDLFAGNPFSSAPPRFVRTILWQYWFSSMDQKRKEGIWWQRQQLGLYGPTLTKLPNGHFGIVEEPRSTVLQR